MLKSVGWCCSFSQFLQWIEFVVDVEHAISSVQEDDHDESLVNSLSEDGSPHECSENWIILSNSLLSQVGWVWVLSSICNSSKNIHDKIDPEKLEDREWTESKSDNGEDDNEEA